MAGDRRPILVTGATGLVGRPLVASLRRDGTPVRIVSRRARPAGFEAGDAESEGAEGGVADLETVVWDGRHLPPEALRGLRAVVHLAGEPIFGGIPTSERKRRIRASRVESTRSIAGALGALSADERPEAFLCASAVGYYGDRGDAELGEDAGPGEGFLAEVCRAWEDAARGAEDAGVRTVRLRTGVVLSREGGALPLMALPFRVGLGGRLGAGSQWVPWIHRDDLVSLARTSLSDARFDGPLNAVAPQPVTNAELTRTLGRVLSRPTLLPVPAFAVRLALGDMASELLDSRRVVPRAAREAGFAFGHPSLEEALREEL